jgi:hypothetical protein
MIGLGHPPAVVSKPLRLRMTRMRGLSNAPVPSKKTSNGQKICEVGSHAVPISMRTKANPMTATSAAAATTLQPPRYLYTLQSGMSIPAYPSMMRMNPLRNTVISHGQGLFANSAQLPNVCFVLHTAGEVRRPSDCRSS